MGLFYPEGHQDHFLPGHPERPQRVERIRSALEESGWWEPAQKLQPVELEEAVLHSIHSPRYLETLKIASRQSLFLTGDTYTTPASWELASRAAGGAAAVAEEVWQGRLQSGFALTRPPGHHATPGRGMGFCLLNNIALAAQHLVHHYGARRLAIVDIDLHHGNGTQDIFWERGDIFYISTHQSPLFPGTGQLHEKGSGAGDQATANLPLPPGAGDQAFKTACERFLLPLLERFGPEMLLVSVGFDTHWLDPLGHLQLSVEGYMNLVAALVRFASKTCQGRIALFLEGGYDLEASAACACASAAALHGKPYQDPLGISPYPENPAWEGVLDRAVELWF
jgi:acetoin utilization deacetylase AcuC-like enzyme